MAYLVNKTNGDLLVSVADGTANTAASDLTFIGKNYVGYGEILNENFLKLLENFSNTTEPPRAVLGQVWYDSSENKLKVYNGSLFKSTAFLTYDVSSPAGAAQGDLWYNSTNEQLFIYKSGNWLEVGAKGVGEQTLLDNTSTEHTVGRIIVGSTTIAYFSEDPTFIPNPSIAGFAAIVPGITINDTIANATIRTPNLSVAANASVQGNLSVTGNISSSTGNISGYDGSFSNNVTANRFEGDLLGDVSGSVDGNLRGNVIAADTSIIVNSATKTVTATVITSSNMSSTGNLSVGGNLIVTGNITVSGTTTTVNSEVVTVDDPIFTLGGDTAPDSSDGKDRGIEFRYHNGVGAGTLGARIGFFGYDVSTQRFTCLKEATNLNEQFTGTYADAHFGTIYGTAQFAQYGDLAEYYIADDEYEPGTVMIFGGENEVTACELHSDTRVAGVVTTAPAYVMNTEIQNKTNAVAIALRGRVPCRVWGPVKKGDLLVTSPTKGCAIAQNTPEPNTVFAKSLEEDLSWTLKTITVVVIG